GLLAILFEGGLTTDWRDIRPVLAPACLLSTLGVAVTAAITGATAYALLDLSPAAAFLLGAVVGSTDAAAVFATLRFTTLRRRLAALLSAESGANDPTAVALTLGLIAWITKPAYGADDLVVLVVRQLGVGLVIGIALGFVAARVLPLLPRDLAPIAPVASGAAGRGARVDARLDADRARAALPELGGTARRGPDRAGHVRGVGRRRRERDDLQRRLLRRDRVRAGAGSDARRLRPPPRTGR